MVKGWWVFLLILIVIPVMADDVFKKIDDSTVSVQSTVVNNTVVSVKDLLKQRDLILAKMNILDAEHDDAKANLQNEIDAIDKQLKGAVDVGVKLGTDPAALQDTTVFATAASSETGLNDLGAIP